jgi:hypothetical protein
VRCAAAAQFRTPPPRLSIIVVLTPRLSLSLSLASVVDPLRPALVAGQHGLPRGPQPTLPSSAFASASTYSSDITSRPSAVADAGTPSAAAPESEAEAYAHLLLPPSHCPCHSVLKISLAHNQTRAGVRGAGQHLLQVVAAGVGRDHDHGLPGRSRVDRHRRWQGPDMGRSRTASLFPASSLFSVSLTSIVRWRPHVANHTVGHAGQGNPNARQVRYEAAGGVQQGGLVVRPGQLRQGVE